MSLLPFAYAELEKHFNLLKALNYKLLPSIYFSDEPDIDIEAYSGIYLFPCKIFLERLRSNEL
ncbi:MAG TPA: hypothetical protein PLM75_03080 [bacterium]|nr:hypothetical protein [bacterium]HPP86829.1 hypothetical protein [bacterium]